MARKPLIEIDALLSSDEHIAAAQINGRKALEQELRGSSLASVADRVVDAWQRRFLSLLRLTGLRMQVEEFPPAGLAAFRAIKDYVVPEREVDARFPWLKAGCDGNDAGQQFLAQAYAEYVLERNKARTKVLIPRLGNCEPALRTQLQHCRSTLGGQAGNIVTLWRLMGGAPRLFIPMRSSGVVAAAAEVGGIDDVTCCILEDGVAREEPLHSMRTGIPDRGGRVHEAPSGASICVPYRGCRQLWMFDGFRNPFALSVDDMPFRQLEIWVGDRLLGGPFANEAARTDLVWPHICLFGETYVENDRLVIRLATGDEVAAAFANGPAAAVLGGFDAVYKDKWLAGQAGLIDQLEAVALEQLRGLKRQHIRIGVEMSAGPSDSYLRFLMLACREGLIDAVGANGEEKNELPAFVRQLSDLDPTALPTELAAEVLAQGDSMDPDRLAFLRALVFAKTLQIPTLYIHTTKTDLILCRRSPVEPESGERSPGATSRDLAALQSAQASAMVSKGLGIGGLLWRNYGAEWKAGLTRLPCAVKPDAYVSLKKLVWALPVRQPLPEAVLLERLASGLIPDVDEEYGLALLPVLWPSPEVEKSEWGLPDDFNSTGAGDMAFGAFFLVQTEGLHSWTPTLETAQPVMA